MNILITGASRGIGKAIAVEAAVAGHKVALVARSEQALQHVCDDITTAGGAASVFVCDVTSSVAIKKLHDDVIASLGSIDAIVCNAGIAPSYKIEETSDEAWHNAFATNVDSAFYLVRAFLPEMKKQQHGKIVMIASTAAFEGFAYTAAYTSSKHALLGLARAIAKELYRYSIGVTTIAPGFVRTAILSSGVENIVRKTGKSPEEAEAELGKMNRSGKIIEPFEVARAVMDALSLPAEISGREIIL